MLEVALKILFLWWSISAVGCIPHRQGHSDAVDASFIGKGTNEIATALLQGTVTKEEDMVFSPFGYSAIMAIFSEGAQGPSKEEIATALHFPSDPEIVREGYRKVLQRFVSKKNFNSPEFKNWFYIYKSFTVKEDFQNLLRKYYLTDVKYVSRPEEYLKEPVKTVPKLETSAGEQEKVQGEPDKNSGVMSAVEGNDEVEAPPNKKIKTSESDEKGSTSSDADDFIKKIVTEGDGSSFEAPAKVGEKIDVAIKMSEVKKEIMKSARSDTESKPHSPESFSAMTDSYLKIKGGDERPQMIIFNGLYYRGEWDQAFERKPAHDSRPFYKSEKEKVFVSTIHSQGVYNTGNIGNLDCRAIELPYKNNRYSLLILVPNTRNGLTRLISDLSGYPLSGLYDQLTEKLTDVSLPCFEVNTISKPISSLQKLGLSNVTSIFNPQTADLSGISNSHEGLYVEELVQMVTFKVEAEYSKANFLTAATAASRSNAQVFEINQPFLFYLRDNHEDIIIVNGKIVDPTPKPKFYFS